MNHECPLWHRILCRIFLHHWDERGGHCLCCGKCDEMFSTHYHCRMKAATEKLKR